MKTNILITGVLGGAVMFLAMAAGRIFLPDFGNGGFRTMPDQVQFTQHSNSGLPNLEHTCARICRPTKGTLSFLIT